MFGCFGDCLGYTKKYDVDSCILPFFMSYLHIYFIKEILKNVWIHQVVDTNATFAATHVFKTSTAFKKIILLVLFSEETLEFLKALSSGQP